MSYSHFVKSFANVFGILHTTSQILTINKKSQNIKINLLCVTLTTFQWISEFPIYSILSTNVIWIVMYQGKVRIAKFYKPWWNIILNWRWWSGSLCGVSTPVYLQVLGCGLPKHLAAWKQKINPYACFSSTSYLIKG